MDKFEAQTPPSPKKKQTNIDFATSLNVRNVYRKSRITLSKKTSDNGTRSCRHVNRTLMWFELFFNLKSSRRGWTPLINCHPLTKSLSRTHGNDGKALHSYSIIAYWHERLHGIVTIFWIYCNDKQLNSYPQILVCNISLFLNCMV